MKPWESSGKLTLPVWAEVNGEEIQVHAIVEYDPEIPSSYEIYELEESEEEVQELLAKVGVNMPAKEAYTAALHDIQGADWSHDVVQAVEVEKFEAAEYNREGNR